MSFLEIINTIDSFVWGLPLIILLLGTGVFLTIRSRFIQVRGFKHAWALLTGKYDDHDEPGETTHFESLATALSATIGTGNIAGVATAITMGGPGAVVWMWITAALGMSIKYHSCMLAQKYREIDENGEVSGGPAYYLKLGFKNKTLGAILGFCFALFTVVASFGIGDMVQANSLADPLESEFGIPKMLTGLVIAALVGAVTIGGIKRIAKVTSKLVPFMALGYVFMALLVLIFNFEGIIPAFGTIFRYAFTDVPQSAGGGFAGATVWMVMRFGVARGLFSNEAGLGSAAIAHAPAKTKEPAREGLVAMLGPFIDTIIVCTMTALVIVISGLWETSSQNGAALTSAAFSQSIPVIGPYIVPISIVLFAFTTMVGWSYYGDRSIKYLFNSKKMVMAYRLLFVFLIPVGAVVKLDIVWAFSDIANALMAIPNLIGVIVLSVVVKKMTDKYFKENKT